MLLTLLDFVAIAVFSFLLVLIISSTTYDLVTRKKGREPKKIFTAFSLRTNYIGLLKLEPKSSNSIECFNGLRALSAFWVVAGNRIYRSAKMVSQPSQINGLFAQFIYAVLRNNKYAVDVFFLMTGVLITQSCIRSFDAKNINLIKIYVTRYLRYVPTVAVVILLHASSFPFLIVNGPTLSHLEHESENCKKWWWSLLLVQNYFSINDVCIGPSWYLSTDFQLFLISPLFIYTLWKFKYKILWLFGAIIVATQIAIFFALYYDIIPILMVYRQTQFRIAQFLIGITLGYMMSTRDAKYYIEKKVQLIGWVASISLFCAIEIFHETLRYEHFPEAFYSSVHRIAFAGLMSWMVYVCHYLKSGGLVNWFFSQPIWQPIARISLSIYLIHDFYIITSIVNSEDSMNLNTFWIIHVIIGDIAISTILGGALYLAIEAPSIVIIKCIFK